MGWNIFWAVLGALAQFAMAWLGWIVTVATEPLSAKRRNLYHVSFVLMAIVGATSIGIVTYRSGRQERAHFSVRFDNTYKPENGPHDRWPFFLVPNSPLAFNIWYTNVGSGSSFNMSSKARVSIQDDESPSSEDHAIAEFEGWEKTSPSPTTTAAKDAMGYFTAHGPILTPEDFDNLTHGRRVVYIVGRINFSDDFGARTQRICEAIRAPQSGAAEIFANCSKYTDER